LDKIFYKAALLRENYLFLYKHLSDIMTADTRETSLNDKDFLTELYERERKRKGRDEEI